MVSPTQRAFVMGDACLMITGTMDIKFPEKDLGFNQLPHQWVKANRKSHSLNYMFTVQIISPGDTRAEHNLHPKLGMHLIPVPGGIDGSSNMEFLIIMKPTRSDKIRISLVDYLQLLYEGSTPPRVGPGDNSSINQKVCQPIHPGPIQLSFYLSSICFLTFSSISQNRREKTST